MRKIALVTPLKDEVENIDNLISSIEQQSIQLFSWLIVENDSSDGSKEKLRKIKSVKNVVDFNIINIELPNKAYALGTKYASIIDIGFKTIKNKNYYRDLNYIGILDSDIFAEKNYFEKLIKSFENNPKLGITSGRIVDENGKYDLANKNWVRGGCRLWRFECFNDAGYVIGPSADTLSVAKARIKKWEVFPTDAHVVSRLVGSRIDYGYYAKSAYFRGHTVFFAFFKSILIFFKGYPKRSYQYFQSFIKEFLRNTPRIDDKEIIRYYRFYLLRKILKKA
jgi:glycosyltransferase involved in cell wall biosynthesis